MAHTIRTSYGGFEGGTAQPGETIRKPLGAGLSADQVGKALGVLINAKIVQGVSFRTRADAESEAPTAALGLVSIIRRDNREEVVARVVESLSTADAELFDLARIDGPDYPSGIAQIFPSAPQTTPTTDQMFERWERGMSIMHGPR